jgi:hypothetical protein
VIVSHNFLSGIIKSQRMKRFISILLLTLFVATITNTKSIAQIDKDMFTYQPGSSSDLFSLFSDKRFFVEMRVNDVNIKAVRDFVKSFENVQDEKWYKSSDSFVLSFTKNSVQTKVVYDLKGRRHCVLSAFSENQMPLEIRNDIKNRYNNYNIIVAYEIKLGGIVIT